MESEKFYYYLHGAIGNDLKNLPLWPFIRSSFYGENSFTSFLFRNQKILFSSAQFDRLKYSLSYFYPHVNWESFKEELLEGLSLLSLSHLKNDFYHVRVMFTIDGENKFNNLGVKIGDDWPVRPFILCTGVESFFKKMDEEREMRVLLSPMDRSDFSHYDPRIKLGHYFESFRIVTLLKEKEKSPFDEILFINNEMSIVDSLFSNLLVVASRYQIIVPPLGNGVLSGVARLEYLKFFQETLKMSVEEMPISKDLLNSSLALILVNGVRGHQFITHLSMGDQEKVFDQKGEVGKIKNQLNDFLQNQLQIEKEFQK